MKKISILLVMLMIGFASSMAKEKTYANTNINRLVLKAVQDFNEICVNGDVTIELRHDKNKAGYIVYNYNKAIEKDIQCLNDGSKLIINGNGNGVVTRIVIFYNEPIKSIVHSGSKRVVARNLVCDKENLTLIANGRGDIKIGQIKAKNAKLISNGRGDIAIKKVKIDHVDAIINGGGSIILKENPKSLNVTNNSKKGEVLTPVDK